MNQSEPVEISKEQEEVIGVFGRAAPTYDRIGPRFFSYFGQRLVELAGVPEGAQVLDVATGRGAVLFPAAEVVGRLGKVVGIDISEPMVQETARDIERLQLTNAEVRRMDAGHLHFADESFGFVFCGFAIFFFPRLFQTLAELRRVLKPNGLLVISSWDEAFNDIQWKWIDDLVVKYLPKESTPERPDPSPPEEEPDLTTEDGLRRVLGAAGFSVRQTVSETKAFFYSDGEELWHALWSHGFRFALEELQDKSGADGLERFRNDLLVQADNKRQAGGIPLVSRAIYVAAVKP